MRKPPAITIPRTTTTVMITELVIISLPFFNFWLILCNVVETEGFEPSSEKLVQNFSTCLVYAFSSQKLTTINNL